MKNTIFFSDHISAIANFVGWVDARKPNTTLTDKLDYEIILIDIFQEYGIRYKDNIDRFLFM